MKTKQNSSLRASALQITLRITLISLSAALLTLAAAPARNQIQQKSAGAGSALQSAQHRAAASESSAAPKPKTPRKSAPVEISASRQRVGGREIAGFTARQVRSGQEENLTPPAGLKPVEQEAWMAMARRQATSGGMSLESFYPARYGEPFVVEAEGVRVAVRPLGGSDVAARIDNGQVIYREAYPETDSAHVVSSGRSEEFLFLQDECAPREFAYELSEVSAGTRVELVNGEVRFTNKAGQGVKIEAPWVMEANGTRRANAVHWQLDAMKSAAGPRRLRLVVAEGLRYPLLIDPSWTTTGSLTTARFIHTATLLNNGKVLVAGGTPDFNTPLSSAELYDSASGTWTATGILNTARFFHTATLLPNGKVLVAGGTPNSSGNGLSSAELYDPASGMWTATGDLHTARSAHTATLLPNGQVLVTGGQGTGGVYLTSAELYDPSTGSWTATGDLATARYYHTATLLPNGQVLVAAGDDGSGIGLSSAELYDPVHGTWSGTGFLNIARYSHSATLLPNGQVLVAGGINGGGKLTSAELYDPSTGMWSNTGSLNTARSSRTAPLLPNGKVLVAGGYNGDNLSSAELYDPSTGMWSTTGSLNTGRSSHTATLLPNGKVLVAAGFNGSAITSAELYDPGAGTWTATGSLGTARYYHTATLLPSGKVLVVGGYDGSSYLSSAELYDPAAGTWTATSSLGTARQFHTATLLPSGKVLVAGGYNGSYLSSAELYDPGAGTWTATGSLGTARQFHTATLWPSGEVLVAGGYNGGVLTSAELYDPGAGTWTSTGSLSTPHYAHTATLLPSGKVLVAGGQDTGSTSSSSAELYDPAAGTWTATGNLGTARYLHTATLLPSGKVLVAGGANSGSALSSAELYDPAMGTWTATGSLNTARYQHPATLLASGKVLVAGGYDGSALSSAELYDPAAGTWTATGNLGTARYGTATLLPSGKVLVAGGANSGSALSSAELYDQGLGFDSNWQPLLTTVSPSILPSGSALTASGSRFKGISEASGGNFQNSSSNYPLVQLLSLANEQTLFLPVDATTGWSDTSFTSMPITLMTTSSSGFPVGYALVTVFTNGIPSQSQLVAATPPPTVQVTVQTNPVGRTFSVDGTPYSSTHTFSWASGSSHTIGTTSPQSGDAGVQYVWSNWSGGGTISHTVTPTTNKIYTATFRTQYYLTMSHGTGGTVTPSNGWRNSGTTVSLSAAPTSGYSFSSWSGSGTGSYSGPNNPASITMNGPITETAAFTQNQVQVTVQTNPAGLTFSVDGTTYSSMYTFSSVPGSSHIIATTSPQSGDAGVRYVWSNWSGGGTISHTVTPTTNKIYTATFRTQYYLTMSHGTGGTVTPSNGWRNSGTTVSIGATPATNYHFGNWTGTGNGSYSGANNPASITMGGPITENATFTHN